MQKNTMKDETVLITGASGYIAMHCMSQLLAQGYRVRGTLRDPSRADGLRQVFAKQIVTDDNLSFVTADLTSDDGWYEAADGCAYVLHTASPIPIQRPRDETEVIRPAVEGTRRVLQAAVRAEVERVVVTSSVAAIKHGHANSHELRLDETYWSNTEADITAYAKSKTLAERAAWDFVAEHDPFELAVINPGMVIGPLLNEHFSTSIETIRRLMQGSYPGCPWLGWSFVDVRDVAAAHIAAMTTPEAAGLRFCCVNQFAWMREVAEMLSAEFGRQGYQIPTRTLPNIVVRAAAIFDKTLQMTLHNLGKRIDYSTEQIRRVLGWQPRPLRESVIATGQSLIEFDLLS
jgi:dihydroflavonol-4-reductase